MYTLLRPKNVYLLWILVISSPLGATSYGIYDARAQAMGGTAIAGGSTSQASFYNPSLLAFNKRDENAAHDGRFSFPILVAEATDSTRIALDALEDELDIRLRNAINRYNLAPNPENTGAVAIAASDLVQVLDQLANQDLVLDAFLGLSVSEPSKGAGGAFVFGIRTLGAATTEVSDEDRALLEAYIQAMAQLGAGVPPEMINPEIIDENGRLRDPVDDLTSRGSVGALAIAEWGVAFGRQFTLGDMQLALGLTPKIMRVDAYRDSVDLSTGNTSINDPNAHISDTRKTHLTFNADLGLSLQWAERYRFGLGVKDLLSKDFSTQPRRNSLTGEDFPALSIPFNPRYRAGLAYLGDKLTLAADYDLRQSTPLADEAPRQDLALGLEFKLLEGFTLRGGYRQDRLGLRADILSAGVGLHWQRLLIDVSYATSKELEAGALHISWAF